MSVVEVQSAFGSNEQPQSAPVRKADVIVWAKSTDLEVLGLLYRYLANAQYFQRIKPKLTREEFVSIAIEYLENCLRDDPQGVHSHNRYEAGWEIAALFSGLWREGEVSRQECRRLKQWMAGIIKTSDSEVQLCLVNATLEHLFEDRKIAKYFDDWSADVALARVYSDAMLWPEQGGTSPIGKSS
jgi:hypothetical protein